MIAFAPFGHVDERRLAAAADGGPSSLTPEQSRHVDGCERCGRLLVGHRHARRVLAGDWAFVTAAELANVRGERAPAVRRTALVAIVGALVALAALVAAATVLGWGPFGPARLPRNVVLAVEGENVVALNLDSGETRIVAPGMVLSMSPDRSLFIRLGADGAHVTRVDGRDLYRIDLPRIDSAGDAAWSPDGRQVTLYNGGFANLSVATGVVTPLPFGEGFKDVGAGSWSPDGSRIAVNGPGCFGVTDPTGGHRAFRSFGWTVCWGATWSPEGDRIATGLLLPDHLRIKTGIGVFDLGGQLQFMHAADGFSWSPDGERLAYILDDGLWIMDADGGNDHRLASVPQAFGRPQWADDGSEILVEATELVVIDTETGATQVVPHGDVSRVDR